MRKSISITLADVAYKCRDKNFYALFVFLAENVAVACTVGTVNGKMVARNMPDENLSRENGFTFYAFHKDHSEFFKPDGKIKIPILVCQYKNIQFSFTEKVKDDPSRPDDNWKESFDFNASRKRLPGTIPYTVWRKDHTRDEQWEYQLTKENVKNPEGQFKYKFGFFAFPANPSVFKKIQYDSKKKDN